MSGYTAKWRSVRFDPDIQARMDALETYIQWAEANGAESPQEARKRQQKAATLLLRNSAMRELAEFAARAQAAGGTIHHRLVQWDVSNGCDLPQVIERSIPPVGRVLLTVPCRVHCERCLRRRKMFWAHRAKAEIQMSQRTWFGTLTMRPKAHAAIEAAAIRRALRSAVNWNDLPPGDRFARIVKEATPSLQRWMKRVRKRSGARLRYILVAEAHESGLPHWHCLVHEVPGSAAVTERELRLSWTEHGGGITEFKIVRDDDPRAAFYVCKYLSKSAPTRIQASSRYGSWGPGLVNGTLRLRNNELRS